MAYDNCFYNGIFRDYGPFGNVRFWMTHMLFCNEDIIRKREWKPYITYINTNAEKRVFKRSEETMSPEELDEANVARKLLLDLNLIQKPEE